MCGEHYTREVCTVSGTGTHGLVLMFILRTVLVLTLREIEIRCPYSLWYLIHYSDVYTQICVVMLILVLRALHLYWYSRYVLILHVFRNVCTTWLDIWFNL